MSRWYFSRPYWLYWTTAGRGARDGRINHPKDGITQQMRPEVGQLDLVREFLRRIEVELATRGDATRMDGTWGAGDKSDYDGALAALDSIMRAREISPENIPANWRREFVRIMVDLIDEQKQKENGASDLLTHYEAELIAIAEEKIESLCDHWEKGHNEIEARSGRVRHEWVIAKKEFEAVQELHSEKNFRQPHPLIGWWFYLAILVGLAVAEYWINMLAFAIVFEKGSRELYVSAALPAIAIPIFAHVVGTQVRYWQGKKELGKKIRWQSVTIVIGSLLFAILTAGALVWLRIAYIGVADGIAISWQDALSIFMLNMAGLWAGIAAAYIAHDVDSDLENICKRKERLLKRFHKVWRQWDKLAGEFDTLRGRTLAEIGKIRSDTVAKIMEYRDYNVRYRADGSVPSVFAKEVGDRFFKFRDFSHELSHTPPAIEDLRAFFSQAGGENSDGEQDSSGTILEEKATRAPIVSASKSPVEGSGARVEEQTVNSQAAGKRPAADEAA